MSGKCCGKSSSKSSRKRGNSRNTSHNHSSRCVSPPRDLVSTPEHMRPGYCGQVRQYNPRDFGLTGNEEWRHPRMFRDMTYETNASFRQQRPCRQPYSSTPAGMNLSNLPDECLADMSAPNFESSRLEASDEECQSPCESHCKTGKDSRYVDVVYNEIVERFKTLRRRLAEGDRLRRAKMRARKDSSSSRQTTRRKIITRHDPCGLVTSQIEVTTVSNSMPDQGSNECTPARRGCEPARRLNFSRAHRSQNLDDESMPTCHDVSMPQECLDEMTMPSYSSRGASSRPMSCLEDETMPSFGQTSGMTHRQLSMPSECLDDITEPSMAKSRSRRSKRASRMTNECLDDMTMPSFGASTTKSSSRSRRSFNSGVDCCLEDVTMPSYGEVSNCSRRQPTLPSECLNDVSAPSFASRGHRSMRGMSAHSTRYGNTDSGVDCCLDDVTMPSFGCANESSRRPVPYSLPMECLNDVSAPVSISVLREEIHRESRSRPDLRHSVSPRRAPMTSECLEDMSMPSCGGISSSFQAKSPRRQQMPSECLEDMSMPTCCDVSGASSRGHYSRRRSRSLSMKRPTECLDDVSMPSLGAASDTSRRRLSMPSECLDDISAPSFGRNISQGDSRGQRSMPLQNLADISAPSFANSTEYGGTSRSARARSSRRAMGNMLSGRGQFSDECLDNVTMPSFGGVSGSSRHKSQRSMPSQNLGDVSAPSFMSSGRGECLDDVTMPSFGRAAASSRRQMTLPSECLNDVSAPSFGRSYSRGTSHSRRSCPSQNLCDESAPSFPHSSRNPMTSECLEDVSMPSFGGVLSSSSRRRQPTLPSCCLEDISAPSCCGVSGSSRRQNTSMPDECLEDESMPYFGNISGISRGQSAAMPSECLEDVSQPSAFGRSFGQCPPRHPPQPSFHTNNECLADVTMPTLEDFSENCRSRQSQQRSRQSPCHMTAPIYARSRRSMMPECIEDMTMPSCGQVSGTSSRSRSRRRERTMPSQNICDISAPTASSRRGQTTGECLDDMTMPSYGNCSGRPQDISKISAPSMVSSRMESTRNECLEDMSMPAYESFGRDCNECESRPTGSRSRSRSAVSRQRCRQPTMTSECLDEMTMPSFGGVSGSSRRQPTLPSECLEDVSAPSFGRRTIRKTSRTQISENVADISAPTFTTYSEETTKIQTECLDNSGASRGRASTAMTNECLDDVTMPSFGGVSGASRRVLSPRPRSTPSGDARAMSYTPARGHRRQRSAPANISECLEDVSAPSFGNCTGMSSRRGQHSSNECLEDVSAPSYPRSMEMSSRRGQLFPSECLDEVTAPSFGNCTGMSSRRGQDLTNECLEDVSAPSYPRSMEMSSRRGKLFPSECLDDVTAPSCGNCTGMSSRRGQDLTNECLEDVSAPSYPRSMEMSSRRGQLFPSECLDEVTAPSFGNCTGMSSRRGQDLTNECLEDVSAPSYPRSMEMSSRWAQPMTNECLDDESAPSFAPNSGMYSQHGQQSLECRDDASNNECLEDVSAPSFARSILVSPRRGHQTSNECLEDVSAPSFGTSMGYSSRPGQHYPSECLDDVSMPMNISYNTSDPRSVKHRPRDVSYPSEMLSNQSCPPYYSQNENGMEDDECGCADPEARSRHSPWGNGTDARLEDESMPSCQDFSGHPRSHNLTMPCPDELEPGCCSAERNPNDFFSSTRNEQSPCQEPKEKSSEKDKCLKDTSKKGPTVVKQITVRRSTTSVTRVFEGQPDQLMNEDGSLEYEEHRACDPNRDDERIEDTSMPMMDRTPTDAPIGYLSDITEPTFGPSFNSTETSQPTNKSGSYHGFTSMDNYMPFDELVGSQTPSSTPGRSKCHNRSKNQSRNQSKKSGNRSRNSNTSQAPRTPGHPCNMVSTSYPYGKPHCQNRPPC
ncbi:LOW QUALITY PROTEIN: uncharacterized protein Dana_GF19385 [Drosophila ananassae]|uniref:Uncharacterized protein n=1 Tax=Drosophila ananassae TaxID=7217 RepID=B3MXR9_DROAN|nr:LOW QUALITY PROTEIN: uncharacterized protein Dana_GF19385 [Drosophila ananassae]